MSSKITVVSASATVPFAYRLVLTTIEPLFAVCGALLVFNTPAEYISKMTRNTGVFAEQTTFLYTELGGLWLYFAFVEAVVLRMFDDRRLWKVLCVGMLLSDVANGHSVAQAVGGWAVWADMQAWTMEEHVIFWSTAPMTVIRLLFLLGVGVQTGSGSLKKH